MRSRRFSLALTLLLGVAFGCTTARIENQRLDEYVPGAGYGTTLRETASGGKVRLVLMFSGGGTRASALSYGVLKELRDTEVVIDGKKSRLLDQVSTISSVSGGSFTSAYYGLFGERIFEDYEDRFLRKDIDARLAVSLFRPIKLFRIMLTPYTRSDMAMDLYDKQVFDGATFADLEKGKGPMLNINATELGGGTVFTFEQRGFDMICSDLSKLPVSHAVTASSAVPGAFAPLLLENHAGSCNFPTPPWITEAMANPTESRRRYHEAKMAIPVLDREQRPYLYLVDGGIADNIGARRVIADGVEAGSLRNLAEAAEITIPDHLLYIVVNAQAEKQSKWTKKGSVPPLGDVLGAISGTGIYRYNFETVQLLRGMAQRIGDEAAKEGLGLKPKVSEVAFEYLPDPSEREFFNNVETSFNLDDETVARLIEVGGRLLRDSPDFQAFLGQLH